MQVSFHYSQNRFALSVSSQTPQFHGAIVDRYRKTGGVAESSWRKSTAKSGSKNANKPVVTQYREPNYSSRCM